MNENLPNIAIIGLGLIGSSIAHAAKHYGVASEIRGFDNSAEVCAEAKQIGLPIILADDINIVVGKKVSKKILKSEQIFLNSIKQ